MVIDEEDAVERQVVVQREEGQGRDGLVDAAELVEAVDRVRVADVTTFRSSSKKEAIKKMLL